MTHRAARKLRLIALAGGLAALGAASLALAEPIGSASGASKAQVTVDPGAVGTATAKCPAGTGVIAAGFASPGFDPGTGGSAVARFSVQRTAASKLRTRGFNFSNVAGELDSIAYCSEAGRSVRVASEKVFVAANSAGVAIATCPRNSEVVAGGFANPGFSPTGSRVLTLTSKRAGKRRWRVEGFSMGDDQNQQQDPRPGTLVAYAYCLVDAPAITTVEKRTAAGEMGQPQAATARCPKGTRALSGGFDGNIVLSNTTKASGAIDSTRAEHGTAWRTRALSISEGPAKTTVYAYCVATVA